MAWQGNGMGAAWERHAMCESALRSSRTSGIHFKFKTLYLVMNCELHKTGPVPRGQSAANTNKEGFTE